MLYLDCSSGVSGDMLVGALIDLGADFSIIKEKLSEIADISINDVTKAGIKAKKFTVRSNSHSKNYKSLIKEIEKLDLSSGVEDLSKNILRTLAIAESKVHGIPLEEVHLHEVSDSLIDSVAFSLLMEDLNLMNKKILCSKISVGKIAPATLEIIRENSIPIKSNLKSGEEIATPTGAAILANIVHKFSDKSKKIKLNGRNGYGAGDMDFEWPNVVTAIL